MEELSVVTILVLAFGLGMLHALDADHIITVAGLSTLGTHKPDSGHRQSVLYCFNWALGHSLTLLTTGGLILFLGLSLPEQFSQYAEFLIGLILLFIGINLLRRIKQQTLHIHFHQHDNMPQHGHWHSHGKKQLAATSHQTVKHNHTHQATLIGSVHGMAGSAAVFALVPVTGQISALSAMAFLLTFCIGTLLAMLMFGGIMQPLLAKLLERKRHYINTFHAVLGTLSMTAGSLLLINNY